MSSVRINYGHHDNAGHQYSRRNADVSLTATGWTRLVLCVLLTVFLIGSHTGSVGHHVSNVVLFLSSIKEVWHGSSGIDSNVFTSVRLVRQLDSHGLQKVMCFCKITTLCSIFIGLYFENDCVATFCIARVAMTSFHNIRSQCAGAACDVIYNKRLFKKIIVCVLSLAVHTSILFSKVEFSHWTRSIGVGQCQIGGVVIGRLVLNGNFINSTCRGTCVL